MNFSEQPPSRQWASLKHRGEKLAEVWFKPEGEPSALLFRIPRESFHLPGVAPLLTAANLLKAVGVAAEEVESWHLEGAPDSQVSASGLESARPLPPPHGVPHLTVHVSLKPPAQPAAPDESREPEVPEGRWQSLEARWHAILGMEASVDTLRISMETVRAELEASSRRSLTPDEKGNALNADIAQWNKAKSRILHTLPKAREFIHRSTWAAGTPARKQLEEIYRSHIQPRIPFPEMDEVGGQLESLFQDRQALFAHGNSVYQECKGVAAEVQGALRTLQSSAAANAAKKRASTVTKGKLR